MNRTRWVVALGVVALLAVALGVPGVAAEGTEDATGGMSDAFHQVDFDEDSIEMEATVGADGDADWRVVYRFDLDGEEELQAFEELQADIEENESAYLDSFEDRIRRTAASGEAATGREMTVENFAVGTDRTTQPDAEYGEVVFTFEWASFAAVGDTVEAGDALDSLFLDDGTSLTLRWDDSLQLDSHAPAADTVDDQRLTWRGPREFDAGEPRAVLHSAGGATAGSLPVTALAAVAVLAVGVGVGVALYLRRDGEPTTTAGADETEAEKPDPQEPPSELLSNEERVLALVENNGGRIKQKEVAEQLDWSAAMTSQVVGDLREAGEIETFRIGRENVLTLPDVDIVPEQDDAETD